MAKKRKVKKVKVPEGDPENGGRIFEAQCGVCHQLQESDDKGLAAPHLYKILGRTSGTTSFNYSNAMKKAKLKWNESNLFQYLRAPGKFVPGNRMSFGGLKDKQELADVIQYLKEEAC